MTDIPEGETMVLDVAQLEALLAKTFNIGLDVGRGTEKVALVGLRLSKALLGAVEAHVLAAESIAIDHGMPTEKIAAAEGLALHAGAFNGIPDPVLHLTARAMGIVTGLAAIEPDPRAPDHDAALDAALRAAAGLVKLLGFRGDCVTAIRIVMNTSSRCHLSPGGAVGGAVRSRRSGRTCGITPGSSRS
jgi:hypothetical protein